MVGRIGFGQRDGAEAAGRVDAFGKVYSWGRVGSTAEEERQHLRVEGLSFEPTGFEFDPDNWVLSRFDDNTSVGDDWQIARLNFSLASIYPNPFNSTATIEYQVPYATVITLSVYNQLGQVVKTLVQGKSLPGSHVAAFNGAELPTGLYFIRLEGGRKVALKKVVLMR